MNETIENKDFSDLREKEMLILGKIQANTIRNKGEYPLFDGIIDIEKYILAKYKILWILREPIDSWRTDKITGEKIIGGWNLTKDLYNNSNYDGICSNTTTRRELLIDNAILNDTKYDLGEIYKYSKIISSTDKEKALSNFKSTAIINIKKIPGKKLSVEKEIRESFNKYKEILIEQMNLYNPDIVLCGNTLHYFEEDIDFRKGAKFPTGIKGHNYFCLKNRIYINLYHPSHRSFPNTKYEHNYIHSVISAVNHWKNEYKKT